MNTHLKLFYLILLISVLVACTSTTEQASQPESPTAVAEVTETTAPPPTETSEPTSTPLPPPTETPAPTDTPAPTNTPEPTNTPTQTPTATALPPSDLVSADNCYLPLDGFTNVGLGVPRYEGLMPSVGTVNAAVLFVDFDDAPATNRTPEDIFNIVSPTAPDFFSQVSYGRMTLNLQPHLTWLRLSRPSAHYGGGISTFYGHREFLQEAIDLADADVDFSTADTVVVLANPDATDIPYGPAFQSTFPGDGLFADGVEIPNGVTSGADLTYWGGLWLNHELGHNMTLPDIYAYSADTWEDGHRFVGPFSLMGLISGEAPEFLAIERWQLDWIDDDQITCQTTGEATIALSAVEQPDGVKAHMVPLSRTSALVIESRHPIGYDSALSQPGVLVYLVDSAIRSGEGPIQVLTSTPSDLLNDRVTLRPSESLEYENVTISVLETSDDGDVIQVTID